MLSRYIRSINDLLARTSHQRTTSEKRTKPLLPKCPLFGGSTVVSICSVCCVQLEGEVIKKLWLH